MSPQGIQWIASYPKSGNTWVRLILATLRAGGRRPDLSQPDVLSPHGASIHWIETILDLPTADLTAAEQARIRTDAYRMLPHIGSPPFWLKVHDRYDPELFPAEATAGTVYIVRDPRDVAPSWAHHLNLSLDETIERMNRADFTMSATDLDFRPQTRQVIGGWSENVRSWIDRAQEPVLVLRYEDMLAAPIDAIARLAEFLGLSVPADILAATALACGFAAVQQAERQTGFRERMQHQTLFFRQGRAGAWRGILSAEQARRLWDRHGETMERLGYGPSGE